MREASISPEERDILTVSEVAVELRCSKAHVCKSINGLVQGVTPLPAISMGRRKLVRRSSLENWKRENERLPSGVRIIPSQKIETVGA
jgi:hypothetical protein